MNRALRRIAVASAMVVAGIGIAATPAMAGSGTCAASYTCIWNSTSFDGGTVAIHDNNTTFTAFNLSDGASANNRADSITANHTTACRSFVYDDGSYSTTNGYLYFYRAGSSLGSSRDPDLTNGGGNGGYSGDKWDNRISSNQYVSSGC